MLAGALAVALVVNCALAHDSYVDNIRSLFMDGHTSDFAAVFATMNRVVNQTQVRYLKDQSHAACVHGTKAYAGVRNTCVLTNLTFMYVEDANTDCTQVCYAPEWHDPCLEAEAVFSTYQWIGAFMSMVGALLLTAAFYFWRSKSEQESYATPSDTASSPQASTLEARPKRMLVRGQ